MTTRGGMMDRKQTERWTAFAAVLAALAPAADVLVDWSRSLGAQPSVAPAAWTVITVGGIAGAVTALLAARRGDRAVLGFGLAVLAYALGLALPGALAPVGTVLLVLARALVLAFGIVLVVRATGLRRTAGWFVTVGAGLWIAAEVAQQVLFRVWIPPQEALTAVFAVPQAGQFVAFTAAALVFVPPLVRPVGAGVRRLWATAEVR